MDFKASFGARDKSLIEIKLASNTALKRNLEKQAPIYEAANRTATSLKVIVIYTAQDEEKVNRLLRELNLIGDKSIVLVEARNDNKRIDRLIRPTLARLEISAAARRA